MSAALRQTLILLAILLGAAALPLLGTTSLPFLAMPERWTEDFRLGTLLPPEPAPHDGIAVVAIDETTLQRFPYRSPIDRAFMADLVTVLQQEGARAIFLDVLFDQPTEPAKDERLREVLATATVPLVISYGREAEGLTPDQVSFLDAFVPAEARAFANLAKDPYDGTARWLFAGRTLPDGSFLPGVVPRIAARIGLPHPPIADGMAIAWRGATLEGDELRPPFRQISAAAVATLARLPQGSPGRALVRRLVEGRVVMVGADLQDRDRHATPFVVAQGQTAGTIPGVVIHAHALAQLMDGRQAFNAGLWPGVIACLLLALAGVLLGRSTLPVWVKFASAALGLLAFWYGGFALYDATGAIVPLVGPSLALFLGLWLTDLYTGAQERSQRKFIQGAFAKYLSPALLDEIVKDPGKLSLDPKRREMSFIFTDVAGFTTISESMDAAQLADVMNRYLDGVVKTVFAHGGTVDKFIGDACFAIFNAPRDQEDHAKRAAACALAIDQYAAKFLEDEQAAGRAFGMTRIGVHTGTASIGNFGSEERFEYTALGDAVNTAARLEGMNKYFGTRVALSGATAAKIGDFPRRPIGRIVLKGKTEPTEVFEPLTAEALASDFIQDYLEAYRRMEQGIACALTSFRRLHEARPDDGPTKLHLKRLEAGETGSVVVMSDK